MRANGNGRVPPKRRTKRKKDLDLKWHLLADKDIEAILKELGAVGRKVGPAGAQQLKEDINSCVVRINQERQERQQPPQQQISLARLWVYLHKREAQLCQAQTIARVIVDYLTHPAGVPVWVKKQMAADSDMELKCKEMAALDVVSAIANLRSLMGLAAVWDGWLQLQRSCQGRIRKPDYLRYRFVSALASIFKNTFQLPVYDGGRWCIFLARVLTLTACERNELDAEAARSLWRRVKKAGLDRENISIMDIVGELTREFKAACGDRAPGLEASSRDTALESP